MSAALIDSNVLIDVLAEDPVWGNWSAEMLERTLDQAILVINALVYSEVSMRFESIEALDHALPQALLPARGSAV